MDKRFLTQKKRIDEIFKDKTEDASKRLETIKIFKEHLDQNLTYPVELTGIEDFNWEEFYVLGPGCQKEYEQLKKTNPSYTDTFNLLKIEEDYNEEYGLIAKVIRTADKRRFKIPLADLMATNEKSNNYKLLDDYSIWHVNY